MSEVVSVVRILGNMMASFERHFATAPIEITLPRELYMVLLDEARLFKSVAVTAQADAATWGEMRLNFQGLPPFLVKRGPISIAEKSHAAHPDAYDFDDACGSNRGKQYFSLDEALDHHLGTPNAEEFVTVYEAYKPTPEGRMEAVSELKVRGIITDKEALGLLMGKLSVDELYAKQLEKVNECFKASEALDKHAKEQIADKLPPLELPAERRARLLTIVEEFMGSGRVTGAAAVGILQEILDLGEPDKANAVTITEADFDAAYQEAWADWRLGTCSAESLAEAIKEGLGL